MLNIMSLFLEILTVSVVVSVSKESSLKYEIPPEEFPKIISGWLSLLMSAIAIMHFPRPKY